MANSNYYQIYIGKVLQLAATIVIKSTDFAQAINAGLQAQAMAAGLSADSAVDLTDPTTWKYYMNLAGAYHPTDTPMQVVSMDTLETIDFTVANLAIHRATNRAYQYGTRQYNELLSLYPQQEMLIRGILYPVDLATAIAADDYTILGGYPAGLVEANEYTLIERLQTWINGTMLRWYNRAYTVSDNLYCAAHWGKVYLFLVPAILNLRLEKCKTNEAHSFHVRQYLASHGGLDAFFEQLTTAQSLALYRNIAYLERHPGQQASFTYLVRKLLTERNLPLAEYDMKHDTSQMDGFDPVLSGTEGNRGSDIQPTIFFERTPLNLGFSFDTANIATLDQLLTKEQPTARDNAEFQTDVEPAIRSQMAYSLGNKLKTKALESAMVDYTDASPYTLTSTLLNHWLWLAHSGYYTAVVNVANPVTGERIALPALDAYAFMWYAFCQTIGLVLDEIPPVLATHVQRIPTPSPSDLMSVVDTSMVGIDRAKWLLSYQPVITNMISTDAFYAMCQQIWRAENIQANIVALEEHQVKRAYVDNMMNRIYADVLVPLSTPGDNYKAWFAARNIDLTGWSKDDFGLVYTSLVATATGQDLTTNNSVAALQKAMIGIMQQLSSYSVQYLAYINSGAIVPLDWPMVRLGDINAKILGEYEIPNLNVRLLDFGSTLRRVLKLPIWYNDFDMSLMVKVKDGYRYEMKDLIRFAKAPATVYKQKLDIPVDITWEGAEATNDLGIFPVLGIDQYLQLTPDQQQNFKDVYGSCWTPENPQYVQLSTLVRATDLNGLVYVQPTQQP
jgi:hypothetical protein